MPNAEIARADAATFQAWLHARQYPADCSATVGLYTRQDYFYALGLGAQMVSLKFNFLTALLQNKVYHFPTSHYVNPLRCQSRSFDCYFETPTNCTGKHQRTEQVKIHWCFDLPRRKLSRLAGLRAVHSKAWYHAQLASFLFRPNRALRELGRDVLANMEGHPGRDGEDNGRRSAAKAAGLFGGGGGGEGGGAMPAARPVNASGRCVAMHIRRTDKHTEDHRTAQRSFADFAQVFKSWGYWSHDGGVASLRAFLGSEDKMTFRAMPPLLQPFGSYWIPSRYFLMDSSSKSKAFFDIRQNNQRIGELYGEIEDAAKRAPAAAAAAGGGGGGGGGGGAIVSSSPLYKDEGMVLVLQILLMSGCDALIASFSSNVAVLVHDLMLARRIVRREAAHVLDINGRVYCGCGASFCMNLERKTVREGGRSIKRVIDGFKY